MLEFFTENVVELAKNRTDESMNKMFYNGTWNQRFIGFLAEEQEKLFLNKNKISFIDCNFDTSVKDAKYYDIFINDLSIAIDVTTFTYKNYYNSSLHPKMYYTKQHSVADYICLYYIISDIDIYKFKYKRIGLLSNNKLKKYFKEYNIGDIYANGYTCKQKCYTSSYSIKDIDWDNDILYNKIQQNIFDIL